MQDQSTGVKSAAPAICNAILHECSVFGWSAGNMPAVAANKTHGEIGLI